MKFNFKNKIFRFKSSRSGFTLLELILFAAVFALVASAFIAILISILRVQTRESSVAEVNNQSQFLMQTIQRYIEESSHIDMAVGETTSTLILRMTSSSDLGLVNPAQIFIYLNESDDRVYFKRNVDGVPEPLSSDRVAIDKLEFTKQSNLGAHDSVDISLSLHFISPSPQRQFSQALQTAVARVNAATFDSDIVPPPAINNLNLGLTGQQWESVNEIIYFSGNAVGINSAPEIGYALDVYSGKVRINSGDLIMDGISRIGIGTVSPGRSLDVNGGGIRLRPDPAVPVCDSNNQGLIWFTDGGGSDDRLKVCMKFGGSTFKWGTLMATST